MIHWSCRASLYIIAIATATTAAGVKYKPYSDVVYDLGPIDKCVKSPMTSCYTKYGLSNDTTTPAYMARFHLPVKAWSNIYDRKTLVLPVSKDCKHYLFERLCSDLVQPVCFKNGTAALTDIVSQEESLEMNKKLLSCLPMRNPAIEPMIAMFLAMSEKLLPAKNPPYPLKQCKEVNLPRCAKNPRGSTTPEYLAAGVELRYTFLLQFEPMFFNRVLGKCKDEFYRHACTYPTCTSDGRLQGYTTKEECFELFDRCFNFVQKMIPQALRIFCEVFPSEKELDALAAW